MPSYFAAPFQFKINVIGATGTSVGALIRNRSVPTGANSDVCGKEKIQVVGPRTVGEKHQPSAVRRPDRLPLTTRIGRRAAQHATREIHQPDIPVRIDRSADCHCATIRRQSLLHGLALLRLTDHIELLARTVDDRELPLRTRRSETARPITAGGDSRATSRPIIRTSCQT